MKISEVTSGNSRWVTWTEPVSGKSFDMLVKPKSGGLDKRISRLTVSSRVGKRGKMEVVSDNKLATKMLVDNCLLGWRNLVGEDGEEYAYTKEAAFELMWNGPAELLSFFEECCESFTQEADEGNAEASDN